jgi:hypothetical protein
VARLKQADSDAELRAYLLAEAVEFRRTYVETQLDDPTWRAYVWTESSKRVDALTNGQPYRFPRWHLPDQHPARAAGKISDELVLRADDVLRACTF